MTAPCCATCKHVKPTQTAWQWVKGKPATQSVCQANGWITRLSAWCGEHARRTER